ncbi:MAG: hypothetical protein HFG85_17580 [Dorea sp.]|nr:hypothetical protein [Dorea sp.]
MDEAKITQIQNENNRLREENKMLHERNQWLEKYLGFNREYIDMAARLKAIEYIVRTSSSYIDVESLAIVLGIPVPKEDDD